MAIEKLTRAAGQGNSDPAVAQEILTAGATGAGHSGAAGQATGGQDTGDGHASHQLLASYGDSARRWRHS
jgi:hypothetical protein